MLSLRIRQRSALWKMLHACAVGNALLADLVAPDSENPSSSAKEESTFAKKSGIGKHWRTGERTQDSRDRNPRSAQRQHRLVSSNGFGDWHCPRVASHL